jgi:glycosyltransferase involved in cell wall biosynthesis
VTSSQLLTAFDTQSVQGTGLNSRSRPLRLLTITPFYPSQENPTQGRFVSEPLAFMETAGVSNRTVAVQPFYRQHAQSQDVQPIDRTTTAWFRYFSVPTNAGLPFAGKLLAKRLLQPLLEEHRVEPFDLIHAHSALPCGHAAFLLSKHLSVPFLVSVHGLDAFFKTQAGSLVGNWCAHVARDVYRSAKVVVCISEKVREQVLSGIQASTTVVYNGVDAQTFSPAFEDNSSLSVLSVGNLISIKGHATLLRAFARVLHSFPDSTLEIIGEGPEQENLIQLAAKLGIVDRVFFQGRQSKTCVADAMRRCSVFALPSVYEGLGCVYLEAMACAKPAVGCLGQGIDEIIEHGVTGMLVSPGDDEELGRVLDMLLRNARLRQKLGSSARETILRKFTIQHQAQKLTDIYRMCLA